MISAAWHYPFTSDSSEYVYNAASYGIALLDVESYLYVILRHATNPADIS